MTDLAQSAFITQGGVLVMLIVNRLISRLEHMESKGVMNEIKHDVNSAKTADTTLLKENSATILRLSEELASLKEVIRNKDATIATSIPATELAKAMVQKQLESHDQKVS